MKNGAKDKKEITLQTRTTYYFYCPNCDMLNSDIEDYRTCEMCEHCGKEYKIKGIED